MEIDACLWMCWLGMKTICIAHRIFGHSNEFVYCCDFFRNTLQRSVINAIRWMSAWNWWPNQNWWHNNDKVELPDAFKWISRALHSTQMYFQLARRAAPSDLAWTMNDSTNFLGKQNYLISCTALQITANNVI